MGKPWMWSQWLCVMKTCASTGWPGGSCCASEKMPLPASRMIRLSLSVRTSMHVVLPP